ncbi:MAG TPA: hypothetical protein OIM49_05860 [Clostridiaceae bacterium]|jgi:hypothetical protein|nr:hypothetical protein [Clostridiaceae bacterium]
MKDLDNIKITNTNSTFSNDFIKKYTNFDNAKDFCNALGIYTLKDLDNIAYIPNIDELIAKNTKFKTLEDFYKAQLPSYYQDVL